MGSLLQAASGLFRPHERGFVGLVRFFDLTVVIGGIPLLCRVLGVPWTLPYAMAASCAAVLYLMAAEGRGLYRSWRVGGVRQEAVEIIGAWVMMLIGLLVLAYLTQTTADFSRRVFVGWSLAGPATLVGARLGLRTLARWLRLKGRNLRTAAIAGAGPLGVRVAETILREPWMGLTLVGFYDDRSRLLESVEAERPLPLCGSLDDLAARADSGEIDVIYLALPMRAEERMKDLGRRLAATRASVYFVPDLVAFALLRSRWFTVGAIPTVSLFETPLAGFERVLKVTLDMVLATAILAVAAIPMGIIAAAVKLTSPGPVIFKQRRRGLDGREIVVWKFRTMSVCEDGGSFSQARRDDPRVTPLGRILRSLSLDEFPQFINVLQGRMSIVGPRPHPVQLDDEHQDLIDWYMLRHKVKPGVTGWAQVNGYRGETNTLEKMQGRVEHDLEYIRNWSIGLDLRIIAQTLFRIVDRRNAF